MADKTDLREWLREALEAHGGRAGLIQLSRHIWKHHEDELRESGNLFYTWQYDVRWAATSLRHEGVMKPAKASAPGIWELTCSEERAHEGRAEEWRGRRVPESGR